MSRFIFAIVAALFIIPANASDSITCQSTKGGPSFTIRTEGNVAYHNDNLIINGKKDGNLFGYGFVENGNMTIVVVDASKSIFMMRVYNGTSDTSDSNVIAEYYGLCGM